MIGGRRSVRGRSFSRLFPGHAGAGRGFGAPTIALVHAAGEILEGSNTTNSLSDNADSIYGDVFAKAYSGAANDSLRERAILLGSIHRGASAIASDQILQAVKKGQSRRQACRGEHGLRCASGGYYISIAADRISRAARNADRLDRRAVGQVRGGKDGWSDRRDGA
jgi:ClpP class serine protease